MKVEARVTGQRRRPAEVRHVDVPVGDIALRELIEAVVRFEVDSFRIRQLDGRLLQVLSKNHIASSAELGRIAPGGSDLDQPVDTDRAITAAVEAFSDGLYFVFVDDVQIEQLDQPVRVEATSSLLFVRLVPLVGG